MVILVAGALANKVGNGGAAWVRLSWILGLRRLGFDVWFVEQMAHKDPKADAWFDEIADQFGLRDKAALVLNEGITHGVNWSRLTEVAEDAVALINLSAHLTLEPLLKRARRRVCVDLDPGVTQLWQAAGIDNARFLGHHFYFTVGTNVGTGRSSIPTNGIHWQAMMPPCVLDEWPLAEAPRMERDRFTTIATWRGPYGRVEYLGHTYGIKLDEFRKFIRIPQEVDARFEIALDIDTADEPDSELLVSNGWRLVDPNAVAGDPYSFRRYVQSSAAEFSVAQGIYVETNSGWISDRTVRYLASGKPALVQDTGFTDTLPTGEGLLAFTSLDDAIPGANSIIRDYDAHSRAARATAVEHFDSDKVLAEFLDQVGV